MTDHSQGWARRRIPYTHGIWQSIKNAIYSRDGRNCQRCGAHWPLTIDHIIPLAEGGENSLTNLQVLCQTCHTRKTAEEHRVRFAHFPAPVKPPPIRYRNRKEVTHMTDNPRDREDREEHGTVQKGPHAGEPNEPGKDKEPSPVAPVTPATAVPEPDPTEPAGVPEPEAEAKNAS